MSELNQSKNSVSKRASKKAMNFITYEELCRQAAHNLSEMTQIKEYLQEQDISYPRRQYLESGIARLEKERDFLVRKEQRINKFNSDNYKFII